LPQVRGKDSVQMTQYDQIYNWMIEHRHPLKLMTAMDAFKRPIYCTKLATRIGEMIAAGYDIRKHGVDTKERKNGCMGYYLGRLKK